MINDGITALIWLGTLAALASVAVYSFHLFYPIRKQPRTSLHLVLIGKDASLMLILGYVAIRRTIDPPTVPMVAAVAVPSLIIYGVVALFEVATAIVFARVARSES